MGTDVYNGANLYVGPSFKITTRGIEESHANISEGRWDGTIRKAHPIWGVMMLAIPFLPMMLVGPMLAWWIAEDKSTQTKLIGLLFSILLALPFTAVATPLSVIFVVLVGVFRAFVTPDLNDSVKHWYGVLKTAEISMESALQTCLGKSNLYRATSTKADFHLCLLPSLF